MIPKECKRLAEVDFPIATVSRHSAGGGRTGQPSVLHLWWARRPLAACRAVLLALLLPDPCDENCPDEFKKIARELLRKLPGKLGASDRELQHALLRFVGDFAGPNNATQATVLEVGRGLVKAAHPEEPPLVVDSFAGGGSIPFEALRLGSEAFASDINPVACLALKVLLQDVTRTKTLEEEIQRIGKTIRKTVENEIEHYYSQKTDGTRPTIFLWSRTVRCESPACGAEIPLMRSFWLCKKAKRKWALHYSIDRSKRNTPIVNFKIVEPHSVDEVQKGTVLRGNATCPCCHTVLPVERVRAQLISQCGGADVLFDDSGNRIGGARLVAVIRQGGNVEGDKYRLANESDYRLVFAAMKKLQNLERVANSSPFHITPDEQISIEGIRSTWVMVYGVTNWGQIFTAREKLVLSSFVRVMRSLEMSPECRRLIALGIDRLVMQMNAHSRWKPTGESFIDMFGRHAIGMVWDFAESSPAFGADSLFGLWIDQIGNFISQVAKFGFRSGEVALSDACSHPLPDASAGVWFIDPPYYDSIPYAHLADCFYVWLRRMLYDTEDAPWFTTSLISKGTECVVDRPHRLSTSQKDSTFFEQKIADAAKEGRRILADNGIASIVFAHKTTEGWEALLSGIVKAGWSVCASWPIATELTSRLNARDTASLATSVHLVCRPRTQDMVGDWGEVLRELPKRVGDWMERLQGEGVRGADLVFACIGPALEIFSRYAKVETAEGREVPLAEYLEKVWEVVGRSALEQVLGTAEAKARNGAAGALEEDARLTALFLWTLQSTDAEVAKKTENEEEPDDEDDEQDKPKKKPGFSLIFDVARRFAQPLGIHLNNWEGRIIETEKGVVRLLAVSERAQQLFGEEGAKAVASRLAKDAQGDAQMVLFPEREEETAKIKSHHGGKPFSAESRAHGAVTTLDRVHAAMLLQANGQANGLRALLKAEQERGADFLRLANALSALYPKDSEEKRLLDAMLLVVPR